LALARSIWLGVGHVKMVEGVRVRPKTYPTIYTQKRGIDDKARIIILKIIDYKVVLMINKP